MNKIYRMAVAAVLERAFSRVIGSETGMIFSFTAKARSCKPHFFGGALISTVFPSIESSISPERARIP